MEVILNKKKYKRVYTGLTWKRETIQLELVSDERVRHQTFYIFHLTECKVRLNPENQGMMMMMMMIDVLRPLLCTWLGW